MRILLDNNEQKLLLVILDLDQFVQKQFLKTSFLFSVLSSSMRLVLISNWVPLFLLQLIIYILN